MLQALNWCLPKPPSQILTNTFFKGTRQPICKHSFSSKIYFPPCLGNLMMHRKYLKKKFPFPVTSLQGCQRIDFFTTWENVFSSKLYLRFIFRHFRFLPGPQTIFWSESAISNPKALPFFKEMSRQTECVAEKPKTHFYILTHSHCSFYWALQHPSQSFVVGLGHWTIPGALSPLNLH